MKLKNPKPRKWETRKDSIVVTVKARNLIKAFKWIFGYQQRKREQKVNELTEERRLLHIDTQHRINKDQAWR